MVVLLLRFPAAVLQKNKTDESGSYISEIKYNSLSIILQ